MRKITIFIGLCLVILTGCVKTEDNPSDDLLASSAAKIYNVKYGTETRQAMDVYLPANRTASTPLVMLIHGGGWTAGNKSDFNAVQQVLSDSGIASVSINYRYVSSTVHYQQLMEDVNKALQHCVDKANAWSIRNTKIIMAGASAGAHMSLLYGYGFDTDNRVSGIISLAGPTNFTILEFHLLAAINGLGTNIYNMVGATYTVGQPLDEKFAKASPVTYNKNVPTLIVHGDADVIVPYGQAIDLRDKLQSKGYTYKMETIVGGGHDLGLANPVNALRVYTEFIKWTRTYSK